jgi:hypothetical protein
MRGSGDCPFSQPRAPCIKVACEIYDEHIQDCGINVIAREIKKLNSRQSE